MSQYENILVEQRGAVTLVTLNRPQALNALNTAVLANLIAAFAAFEADESQRPALNRHLDLVLNAGRRNIQERCDLQVLESRAAAVTAHLA